MQKNRKRPETSGSRHYPATLPEVVNVDVLGAMLDEDLIVRLRSLEADKDKAYEAYGEARPWEEEIAYIRREQQIRRIRRDEHSNYVRQSELEFARAEAGLPAGDFDNSTYVYAATGGRPRWD